MCVTSNMGDIVGGMWPSDKPWRPDPFVKPYVPYTYPYMPGIDKPVPGPLPGVITPSMPPMVFTPPQFPTKAQFEAFIALLKAAMKFDEVTGQKKCETAAKTAWIKSMCDHFGVECPLK